MASSKGKSSAQAKGKGERLVYSEFPSSTDMNGPGTPALERATPDLPPAQQNLRVEASRKGRKGKTVTVISGFQCHSDRLTELLKKLKTQWGAGGTVKDNTLEIQGHHTQKLVELLIQLGYRAKASGG